MDHLSPISTHHLSLLLFILLLWSTIPTTLAQGTTPPAPGPTPSPPPGPSGDFLIGSLRSCAHNISGDVHITSANQITIKNFSYDGQGKSPWFHLMTPKALSIHAALPDTFAPVSNDKGECAGLNRSYSQEELKITLPIVSPLTKNLTINHIKSFGLFSYQDCSNYGNVYFVHKWPALYKLIALGGLAPPTDPKLCPPPVIPDLSNPDFCNPGDIKFKEFFGECVEQYGAIPRSSGSLTVSPVEIFGRSFFLFLIAYLGMLMTAVC